MARVKGVRHTIAASSPTKKKGLAMGTGHILVVEDETDLADVLVFLLRGEGYQVQHAANASEALEMLTQRSPDLVVTDVMMPILDGCGLLETMQGDDQLRAVPVVVVSSLAESRVRELCGELFTFLSKPFRAHEMLAIVEELLQENQA
jgi:CheY-like chemotaxis protein